VPKLLFDPKGSSTVFHVSNLRSDTAQPGFSVKEATGNLNDRQFKIKQFYSKCESQVLNMQFQILNFKAYSNKNRSDLLDKDIII
jgi:hypothetical protein